MCGGINQFYIFLTKMSENVKRGKKLNFKAKSKLLYFRALFMICKCLYVISKWLFFFFFIQLWDKKTKIIEISFSFFLKTISLLLLNPVKQCCLKNKFYNLVSWAWWKRLKKKINSKFSVSKNDLFLENELTFFFEDYWSL